MKICDKIEKITFKMVSSKKKNVDSVIGEAKNVAFEKIEKAM